MLKIIQNLIDPLVGDSGHLNWFSKATGAAEAVYSQRGEFFRESAKKIQLYGSLWGIVCSHKACVQNEKPLLAGCLQQWVFREGLWPHLKMESEPFGEAERSEKGSLHSSV